MGNMRMITHQMPYASLAAGGLLQWQCGAVGHLQKHKMVRVVGAHKQQKVDHLCASKFAIETGEYYHRH